MPLPIIVNATAARLTGEYLVSGKAVAIALFAALLVHDLRRSPADAVPWRR